MFWFEVMVYQYTAITVKLEVLNTSVNMGALQTVCNILLSQCA